MSIVDIVRSIDGLVAAAASIIVFYRLTSRNAKEIDNNRESIDSLKSTFTDYITGKEKTAGDKYREEKNGFQDKQIDTILEEVKAIRADCLQTNLKVAKIETLLETNSPTIRRAFEKQAIYEGIAKD